MPLVRLVEQVDRRRPLPNALPHLLDGSSLDPDALEPPGRPRLGIGLYHGGCLGGLSHSGKGYVEVRCLLSLGSEVGIHCKTRSQAAAYMMRRQRGMARVMAWSRRWA
jgi:hypothetical protein